MIVATHAIKRKSIPTKITSVTNNRMLITMTGLQKSSKKFLPMQSNTLPTLISRLLMPKPMTSPKEDRLRRTSILPPMAGVIKPIKANRMREMTTHHLKARTARWAMANPIRETIILRSTPRPIKANLSGEMNIPLPKAGIIKRIRANPIKETIILRSTSRPIKENLPGEMNLQHPRVRIIKPRKENPLGETGLLRLRQRLIRSHKADRAKARLLPRSNWILPRASL